MPVWSSISDARITFDSVVFWYFARAASGSYDPAKDTNRILAAQRVAALRIFLYHDLITVMPTVAEEVRAVSNPKRKELHDMFLKVHFVQHPIDPKKVDSLARYYQRFHGGPKDEKDCRIVAEAELTRMDYLLTWDGSLWKHLQRRTGYLKIVSPAQFWEELNLPRGRKPRLEPAPSNPLASVPWWRW